MRQALELKLGQKLAMTPQLQQSIRMLQLSVAELQVEIQDTLDSNPLLERVDQSTDATINESSGENVSLDAGSDASKERDDYGELSGEIASESGASDDRDWDDYTAATSSSGDSDDHTQMLDRTNASSVPFRDQLIEQFRLLPLSQSDRIIGAAIIESIDDKGYLDATLEEIEGMLPPNIDADVDEIEAVLHQIQNLDPPGIAARDLRECLSLQLRAKIKDNPLAVIAMTLVEECLEQVGQRDFETIEGKTGIEEEEAKEAIKLIQTCHAHPATLLEETEVRYIAPDVVVKKNKQGWQVSLYQSYHTNLRVNANYKTLIKRGDKSKDNKYMQERLQQAQWFIRCIKSREDTVLDVARTIVMHQTEFLEEGEVALEPLVMRDIAEKLELHESTISRATTNKYALTPSGLFELRHFFSSHVKTLDGGKCSARSVQARIKVLVDGEDKKRPFSDNKLAELLKDQGIAVARRTVAKYRENMRIPPSHKRKAS